MIGSNLKYIMDKVGHKNGEPITIQELAEMSGVSDTTIGKMRKNELIKDCRLITLEKVAKALGCKTKDLYSED